MSSKKDHCAKDLQARPQVDKRCQLGLAQSPEAEATSGEEDMLIHGERLSCTSKSSSREQGIPCKQGRLSSRLVPTSLRRLVVRAAGTQWHFDPQIGEEPLEIHEARISSWPGLGDQ